MARRTVFIEQLKKGDEKLTFDLNADFVWAPSEVGIVLERPFDHKPREERGDGTKINPALAPVGAATTKLVSALKKIDGIAHVEMRGYWMRIKIGRGFQPKLNTIMLSVLDAINASWDEELSFSGYSPYVTKHWQEFRFERKDRSFLPRLITTMFSESAGMVIEGSWEGFKEGPAFVSGFRVDNIARGPKETDEWTIEMIESLGGEMPELVIATSSTQWRINRSGKYEDGGQDLYGGKLHFNIKSGKGVIYEPGHK